MNMNMKMKNGLPFRWLPKVSRKVFRNLHQSLWRENSPWFDPSLFGLKRAMRLWDRDYLQVRFHLPPGLPHICYENQPHSCNKELGRDHCSSEFLGWSTNYFHNKACDPYITHIFSCLKIRLPSSSQYWCLRLLHFNKFIILVNFNAFKFLQIRMKLK